MDKENAYSTDFNSSFCFPAEFPYEFDSFGSCALSFPVESVEGSTETESSDEDDFLVGLTRRMTQQLAVEPNKKKWVMAGSPESTLGGIGSWSLSSNGSSNGEISPPKTPFGVKGDLGDLIYAAAGPVSRLKMTNESIRNSCYQGRELLGPARRQNPDTVGENRSTGFLSSQSFGHSIWALNQYQLKQEQVPKPLCPAVWGRQQVKEGWQDEHQHQQQYQIQRTGRSIMGYDNERRMCPLGLPQSAWPPLQVRSNQHPHQHHQQSQYGSGKRAVFLSGSNATRECAGTGVFLPRGYTNPSACKKKSACSTVLVPTKVAQSLDVSLEDLKKHGHTKPRFNGAFGSDCDALMERNGLLAPQKGNLGAESVRDHEICLPQEWMY
ncbi:hypothetical protein P3X46_025654 [Hevea brasiliensis]|uniref:Growth-regulating factor n=1 Tax=Hevea brasiliensis TaxID=3981 RepID=A0ABQ9L8Z7_HEVBR|nr:uncharacterized protein LOC110661273 [Hevea brasiliensis]KAJ9160233.1 hypothetical protein P3X46_025654 [Hevea brasiliensis]